MVIFWIIKVQHIENVSKCTTKRAARIILNASYDVLPDQMLTKLLSH